MRGKMTPWFPGHVKPTRPGAYARQSPAGPFSYWDGKRWGLGSRSPAEAANAFARAGRSDDQSAPWRGFVRNQDAPKPKAEGMAFFSSKQLQQLKGIKA
jgi:hypothetical protein